MRKKKLCDKKKSKPYNHFSKLVCPCVSKPRRLRLFVVRKCSVEQRKKSCGAYYDSGDLMESHQLNSS